MMNAGAGGQDIGSAAERVELFDPRTLKVSAHPRGELSFSYRSFRPPLSPCVVTSVDLALAPEASPGEASRRMRQRLAERGARIPKEPSAGSFFKNPPGAPPAGRLIEECGLKGKSRGGCLVSPKHANILVNTGGALTADILALAEEAEEAVFKKFGVRLEREVRVVPLRGEERQGGAG